MAFSDPILYTVLKIDGDYAWLRRVTDPAAEPIMVALALLPNEVTEGCRVQRVMFDYSMA
ncbi:MAG: chorismate--pyruvate lyase [Clostridiales bacterium]|nr:chorismate--pyruvate lyase [Clostridiales bacterium]